MPKDPALDLVASAIRWEIDDDPTDLAERIVTALRDDGHLPPLPAPTPLSVLMDALENENVFATKAEAQAVLNALANAGFPSQPAPAPPNRIRAVKVARNTLRTQGFFPSLKQAVDLTDAVLAATSERSA